MIWPSIRNLVALLTPEDRRRWVRVLPLLLITSASEAVGAAAVFVLVAAIAEPKVVTRIPLAGERLVELAGGDPARLGFTMVIAIGAFYLLKSAVIIVAEYSQAVASTRTAANLATRLYTAYLGAPYRFHLRRNASDLVHATTMLAGSYFGVIVHAAVHVVAEVLVVVGIAAVLFLVAPGVTLLAVGVLSAIGALLYTGMRRYAVRLGRLEHELDASTMRQQSQALRAIDEITVLDRTQFFAEEFAEIGERRAAVIAHQKLAQALPRVLVEALFVSGVVAVTVALLTTGASNTQTISLLGLFAYAGFRVIPSANRILYQAQLIGAGQSGVERIRRDLEELGTIVTGRAIDTMPSWTFSQGIELKRVAIDYDDGSPPVLRDVSLSISRGQSFAIVGATGSGKSSLVRLLVGLLTPSTGEIAVDGMPLQKVLRGWRRQLGYVPQEVHLLDETLLRNIAIGIPPAAIDNGLIADCVAGAQLKHFIESLPDGFSTRVGDRGVRLSGGERQRVGIARALYHRPAVLILDEATSSLDPQTAAAVLEALRAGLRETTLIAVTHRLHGVRAFDRVAFMVGGSLRGVGTFDELLAALPEFRQLAAGIDSGPPADDNTVGGDGGPAQSR